MKCRSQLDSAKKALYVTERVIEAATRARNKTKRGAEKDDENEEEEVDEEEYVNEKLGDISGKDFIILSPQFQDCKGQRPLPRMCAQLKLRMIIHNASRSPARRKMAA